MKLTKAVCLLLVSIMLGSCIGSTRHTASIGGCLGVLQAGDSILVGAAPNLSAYRSHQLYQQLEQVFREKGLYLAYAAEQELELAQHGLKQNAIPDSANLELMHKLGYTYYLEFSVGKTASGTAYTRTSAAEADEIRRGYGTAQENASEATVHFQLYSTQAGKPIYTLVTTTQLSGVTLPGKGQVNSQRGSSTLNLSTASMATEKAIRKGASELLKNCNLSQ